MENQVYVDLATINEVKSQMGVDFALELIDTYCMEAADHIQKLQQALASADTPAFRRLAHSIKTSSESLGALNLSQQARELEMMARAEDLSGAGPKVERLAADFLQVKRCLEEIRNEP